VRFPGPNYDSNSSSGMSVCCVSSYVICYLMCLLRTWKCLWSHVSH
jgi:hypothetical protein